MMVGVGGFTIDYIVEDLFLLIHSYYRIDQSL